MSEMMRSSAGLDERRRRILYRAWHRGTREMDYVLGTFSNREIENLTEEQLEMFEVLMQAPDPDMYKWLSGSKSVPQEWDSLLVNKIRSFHMDDGK